MSGDATNDFLNKILAFTKEHRKPLIIIALIAIVGIVIIGVIEMTRNAYLYISVTPTDSVIMINGRKYQNGTHRLHPGTVTATISHEDFDTKEVTLDLKSHQTVTLAEYLTQNGGFDYYNDHKTDFITLQNIYNSDSYSQKDEKIDSYFDEYKQVSSLREMLPLTAFVDNPKDSSTKYAVLIKEDPGLDCQKPICLLVIDDTKRIKSDETRESLQKYLRTEALNLLKKKGYNPEDYHISYSDNGADY